MYGIFGRKITIHTVIYGVYIQLWPTLDTAHALYLSHMRVWYSKAEGGRGSIDRGGGGDGVGASGPEGCGQKVVAWFAVCLGRRCQGEKRLKRSWWGW